MSDRSPGPWFVVEAQHEVFVCCDQGVGREELATVHSECELGPLDATLNAHLMAAAPDLLDHLKRTTRTLREAWERDPKKIEAAISYIEANEALIASLEK